MSSPLHRRHCWLVVSWIVVGAFGYSPSHDACGYANDRAVRGHVVHHHRVGADADVVADAHAADDLGARTDEHAVSEHGRAPPIRADRHLVLDVDVRAAADVAVDDHAGGMNEHQPRTEARLAADDAVVEDTVHL